VDAAQLPSVAAALALQRATGNRAFVRLMRQCCGDGQSEGPQWHPRGWRRHVGTPFLPGAGDRDAVDPNDVRQEMFGDCAVMASLAAVAAVDPAAIRRLIHERPDGSYDVTLHQAPLLYDRDSAGRIYLEHAFGRFQDWRTNVTPDFPDNVAQSTGDSGPGGAEELWVLLLERAYARMRGGYERINGGLAANALAAITGRFVRLWEPNDPPAVIPANTGRAPIDETAVSLRASDAEVFAPFAQAWAQRKATVCATPQCFAADTCVRARWFGAVADHAYALVGVNPIQQTIDLRNPWGGRHLLGLPVAAVRELFAGVYRVI
jgi:hypothetical protein